MRDLALASSRSVEKGKLDRPVASSRTAFQSKAVRARTRPGARTRRLADTLQSLQTYVALIRARSPQTVRELMSATALTDGTLYPVLQKRVALGLIRDSERDGVSAYALTPSGYRHAREALLPLQVDAATWMRAERAYED